MKSRVLVIDDESELREIIREALELENLEIEEAANGFDALRILENKEFDVILSDVRMPQCTGVELLEAVRSRGVKSPFVFVSGYSDVSEFRAYSLGASAIFKKPFQLSEIVAYIKTLLKHDSIDRRRAYPRIPYKLEVVVSGVPKAFEAFTVNLSEGGMFVGMQEFPLPEVGVPVSFKFPIQDDILEVIQGLGIVRWQRIQEDHSGPRGVGIQFSSLQPKETHSISQLVRRLFAKTYPDEKI